MRNRVTALEGYSRSVTGLYRVLRRKNQMAVKPPNPKYMPKLYGVNALSGTKSTD